MATTYRITSCLAIGDATALALAVFPQWNGEPMTASPSEITVTFPTPQTPANLGPLVVVEAIDTPAP